MREKKGGETKASVTVTVRAGGFRVFFEGVPGPGPGPGLGSINLHESLGILASRAVGPDDRAGFEKAADTPSSCLGNDFR